MRNPSAIDVLDRPAPAGSFWSSMAFILVICGALAFVLLTVIAMFVYPGGTRTNPGAVGYSFLENPFSALGRLKSWSGASNTVGAALFALACLIAGSSLTLFFLSFPLCFRATRTQRTLSVMGSVFGVLAGLCFVGVALAPADLWLPLHRRFFFWAFRFFTLAVLLYVVALFNHQGYARRYGWALVGYFLLQFGYLLLLQIGPSAEGSYTGMVVQATGQKIIVYASLLSIAFQAWGARSFQGRLAPTLLKAKQIS